MADLEHYRSIINKDPKLKCRFIAKEQEYDLALILKNTRKKKGLSQADIAELTGLTQQMISKMEKYNGTNESLSSFLLYCSALNINIVDLINHSIS